MSSPHIFDEVQVPQLDLWSAKKKGRPRVLGAGPLFMNGKSCSWRRATVHDYRRSVHDESERVFSLNRIGCS